MFFCNGKQDICNKENCTDCEFFNGSGGCEIPEEISTFEKEEKDYRFIFSELDHCIYENSNVTTSAPLLNALLTKIQQLKEIFGYDLYNIH